MKIKLCDKYFIEVSVSSYDLYEIIPEKVVNGRLVEQYNKSHGYHGTLMQAIKWYVKTVIIDSNTEADLLQYVKLYTEQVNRIEEMLKHNGTVC